MTEVNNPTEEILSRRQALSAKEEALLWKAIEKGDSRARDQLVERHFHLIYAIAIKVVKALKPNLKTSELWSAGTEGLLSAVAGYNPQRGKPFSSYAGVCIYNAMREEVMDSFTIRIPKHRISEFKKINKVIEDLLHDGIDKPSDELIAEKLGTTAQIVSELRPFLEEVMISFDEPIGDDSSKSRIEDADDNSAETQALLKCYENALKEMGIGTPQDRRLFEEGSDDVYEMRSFFSRLLTEESAWKFIDDIKTREGDPYANRISWIRGII